MKKQTSNKTGILSALASFWNEETIEEYVSLSDINDIDEKTKLLKRIIELNEEYESNNSYYNNALQNKRRSYEYYLDALNREKSGSKKVGATK